MVQKNEKNEDYPMFLVSKILVSWMEYYCRRWFFAPIFKAIKDLKACGGQKHSACVLCLETRTA